MANILSQQFTDELDEYLMAIQTRRAWCDSENMSVSDASRDNVDEAYAGGVRDGEIMLARYLKDRFFPQ